MRPGRVVGGFAVGGLLLAVLVLGFGAEGVLRSLERADGATYALAPVASVTALGLWAVALHRLTRRVPGAPDGVAFAGAFATGLFLRGLAPWGRSGGSLLMAAALDRAGRSRYEEVLGATATAEFLGTVGSTTVAVAGLCSLLLTDGPADATVTAASVLGAVLAGLALVAVAVLWAPGGIVGATRLLLGLLRATVGRVWGRADRFLAATSAVDRVDAFLDAVRHIASAPRTLLPAVACAQAAALATVVGLWASLAAVDAGVALSTLMVVLPLANLAGVVPLPGGTGGVEFALVGLLVAATGGDAASLTAAVLLFRLATYWFHLLLGGTGAVLSGGTRGEGLPG